MKIAIIYNKDFDGVINRFGIQNREVYSEECVRRVYEALEFGGHNVEIIDGNMYMAENLQEFMPKVLHGEKMGMVFNMAYGIQGESRYTHIPAFLEMLGVPYIGSNPSGHSLALDKVLTKIVLQKYEIPTPEFWVFNSDEEDMSMVEYPVIAKPKMESVSFGLKVANNEKELKDAVRFIVEEFSQQVLVEKFIRGREFCVGILGNGESMETLPVLEIDLNNDPDAIQSFEDKKYKPKDKICPALLDEEKAKIMRDISMEAFRALGLRDFSRVDLRMNENGDIFILEINSMASLGKTGSYVKAAGVAGYTFDALVNKMVKVASRRYFKDDEGDFECGVNQSSKIKIRSYLRKNKDSIENTLKKLVDMNTYVRNIEGVNTMRIYLKNELERLGFSSRDIPQVEIGDFTFMANCKQDKYDVLFLINIDGKVKLPNHRKYRKDKNKLFGTDIWTAKGGIVSQLAALKSLHKNKSLKNLNVAIVMVSDDSIEGRFSRDFIRSISKNAKVVIGNKGSGLNGGIITSRSGSAQYECHMNLLNSSEQCSSVRAVSQFTKCVTRWSEMTDIKSGLIVLPEDVNIQSKISEPYSNGYVKLNIRFNENQHVEDINTRIRGVLPKKNKKYYQIYIRGGVTRPAMVSNKLSDDLLGMLREISAEIGTRLQEEHVWESSNICFVEDSIPTIDGIGPTGGINSNGEEFIYSHSIVEKAQLIAILLHRMGKSKQRNDDIIKSE